MEPISIKNLFPKKYFSTVEDLSLLQSKLTYNNILRLRIMAWLLISFMLILIITQLTLIDNIDVPEVHAFAPYIIIIRLIIISGSVGFLVISGRPTSPNAITRRHSFCESGFVLLNLICFAGISGLINSIGPGVASSYIMAVLVSSAFLCLNWSKIVTIYGLAWLVMSFTVWHLQSDWVVASSTFLNCSFTTILAIVISQTLYINKVKEFQSQKIIELQKEELAVSNEVFKRMSYLDALTNIPNRRFFDEFLIKEWQRSISDQEPISLIMADIDYFKLYNDNFGHQAGDNALIQVATAMSCSVKRPGDLVARYGGEEFAVILPKTDLMGARQIAERIKQAVEKLNINHPFSLTGHLTISLGIACLQLNDAELPENLINTADNALYHAKKAGRNKCVWADPKYNERVLTKIK